MPKFLIKVGVVALVGFGLVACTGQANDGDRSGSSSSDSGETLSLDAQSASPDSGGSGGGDTASDAPADATVPAEAVPVDLEAGQLPGADREIISTADLAVSADDVQDASDAASRIVGRNGGYVFQQSADLEGDQTIDITFKVPPERFDAMVTELSGLGTLEHRQVSTDDVTGEVVDLEARLATARASADRLRALLTETGSVVDLVAVEQALAVREAEVESLEGQLRTLSAQADLGTITVHFLTRAEAAPGGGGADDGETGFLAGLEAAVDGLVGAAKVGATIVGFVLPFSVLAAAGGVVYLVARRRRTSRPADVTPS